MKKATRVITLLCAALLAASCLSGCEKKETVKSPLDPKNPTSITVWNYYNGAQLATFNEMVGSFNETRGKELGIVVSSVSQGSVNDLHTNVMNAVAGKVGAEEVPNIFAAYADRKSVREEIRLLKQLPSAPAAAQRKTSYLPAVRCVFLGVGLGLLLYGFFTGGTVDVLTKAINICTECVGLG